MKLHKQKYGNGVVTKMLNQKELIFELLYLDSSSADIKHFISCS